MTDSFDVIAIGSGPDDGITDAEAGEFIHRLTPAPDRDTALRLLAAGRYNHPARCEGLLIATEAPAAKWGTGVRVSARSSNSHLAPIYIKNPYRLRWSMQATPHRGRQPMPLRHSPKLERDFQ